ncbi:MAG: L-threonylcarbamoyladenylate synthase [Melioribacteraceae bacterium]|nr:L-threonylcarbamoyladenylate synthase [Melioribacteraceae bacterium]WKZ69846.1 MAG: L-threonylcarbamoyladenylate synthase [Melioribacteraceae bacterium]
MKPVQPTSANIKKAADIIRSGGTVAFPTETVYGLGADGLNPVAVAKIFDIKNRPTFNPLILHIGSIDQLHSVCRTNNDWVNKLIEKFWPGPLTLVLPKKEIVPEIVTADNPTVAVRMPDNKIALELIKHSQRPIAAPSANLFNRLSPTTAEHVYTQIGNKVDMIIDGGATEVGVESTIVEIENENVYLLRPGGITKEEIEKLLDRKVIVKQKSADPNSPGQLPFHYSPRTPLYFLNKVDLKQLKGNKVGAIFLFEQNVEFNFSEVNILSEDNNLREAAANLFSALHHLDEQNLDLILVEPIPEEGLGLAMMDRLNKAAANFS